MDEKTRQWLSRRRDKAIKKADAHWNDFLQALGDGSDLGPHIAGMGETATFLASTDYATAL